MYGIIRDLKPEVNFIYRRGYHFIKTARLRSRLQTASFARIVRVRIYGVTMLCCGSVVTRAEVKRKPDCDADVANIANAIGLFVRYVKLTAALVFICSTKLL